MESLLMELSRYRSSFIPIKGISDSSLSYKKSFFTMNNITSKPTVISAILFIGRYASKNTKKKTAE
jgi:hypothetical protein